MSPPQSPIAIVSDEAAPGFADAVGICLPLGIQAYELRRLGERRLPDVSAEALMEVVQETARYGLTLVGISPGLCKTRLDRALTGAAFVSTFERNFALMERLDVHQLTVFTYLRTASDVLIPPLAIDLLGCAAELCRREGVRMVLENTRLCWADTGVHLAQIARAVGVEVVWDPANAAAAGEEAYPEGYAAVRDLIAHVHLKNWHPESGWVTLDNGVVDLDSQVRALKHDGYAGYYCVENHRPDDPTATETNVRALRRMLRAPQAGTAH